MKIFISYSHSDIEFVRKLAGDLEQADYEVWWDKTHLRGGARWQRKIRDAITDCDYLIVVLTPSSVESEWVEREYTKALSLNKSIIPIQLAQCEIPIALDNLQLIDFQENDYQDNFNELLAALEPQGDPPVVTPFKPQLSPPSTLRIILLALAIFIAAAVILLLLKRNSHPNQPPVPTATSTLPATLVPTAIPVSVPAQIIVTYGDGKQTSYDCPTATLPAALSSQGKISLELSAEMPEKTLEKLEWVYFVSGVEEPFGIGKTASYSPAGEGIIYISLDQKIICTLNVE